MYTRCPGCQSLFRITTRQLKAARGKVRCGECQLTFDAIEFLVNRDELSKSEQKAAAKLEHKESSQWQLPFDNEPTDEAGSSTSRDTAETPADAPHWTATEVATETAAVETQAAAAEKSETEPAPPVEMAVSRESEASTAMPLPISKEEEREAATESLTVQKKSEPTTPPLKKPLYTANPVQPRYSLPEEAPPPHRSRLARLAWAVASLLLVVALAAQLALLNRTTLLDNYPATKPWLEQLCQVARCEQPTRRDLMAVEMIERTVLTHPEYQKALLITATLVNKAPFAQPYPVVELIMTNLEQKAVASRRFLPAEYLKDGNPNSFFAPGAAIRLRLEVVDPGEEAVGFEFAFH